ncbi:hypothetical protein ACFOQM_06245 [Paenibacillus sp. GCM10012307]|uniref:Uncharacterized protein n=1 Tax=Paenibacillus roseus TaxID=2798579 RepID=A0A934J065_9BACL|nr:hypothetical protein [Paenibacillus roseus]MBJ6360899.1 hypothetical protein [Paenibacillus roseus]
MIKVTDIDKTIKMMIAENNIDSKAALGELVGIKNTTFRAAIANNSLRLADFIRIADALGYTITVSKE